MFASNPKIRILIIQCVKYAKKILRKKTGLSTVFTSYIKPKFVMN